MVTCPLTKYFSVLPHKDRRACFHSDGLGSSLRE
uniref:Uncharacterized protein n=1 Tax=Amphimedon queenslandica TaxID=400682 RepID=A0A1X7TI72_AMPQE